MITFVISDKLKKTVDRMYSGAERDRIIDALKAGTIIYRGAAKLKADKVESEETPAAPAKTDEKKQDDKSDTTKDKYK